MDNLRNPFWAAGQARATREVGKRLALKHDVTVYSSKYPNYQDYEEDGIRYIHIGLGTKSPKLNNLAFIFSIPFLVAKMKADIIIENFNAPFSVSLSPLFTKIPIIGLPTMFAAEEFSKKYHLPFHWVEKFGMRFYKYMLPYSATDSAKAKELNPEIIYKIVPPGVGEEFFTIKHKKPKHILFLGRFDIWQKGIDMLIEAYVKVKDQIKYPLVIAGHGPDEKKIRFLIKELKLEKLVKIVGPAYGEKKQKLISEALFVAFPSRHDEYSVWSLEALASGMPLICFDLPESKWMTNKISLKAKPFDIDQYSQLLLKATDAKVISEMRKEARQFAKKYPWGKVVGGFEEFFKEVLENEKVKNKQSFSTNKQSFSKNKNLSFAQNLDFRSARIKQSFSTNKSEKVPTLISYKTNIPKIEDEALLCFAESKKHIPFAIKRFYFIYNVENQAIRGMHAHKKTLQFVFCIKGKVKMILDNGRQREEVILAKPNQGIFLDKMVWHEMADFQKDTILLVMASEYFDENDYIRDYGQFLSSFSNVQRIQWKIKLVETIRTNLKIPVWLQRYTSIQKGN